MTATPNIPDFSNPFPGLRCFLSEEDYLFFGRHEQIEDLLRRLRTNRLVAVVGTSGSGKSSLVRAGLLPAVLGGGMAQSGSDWEIAVMRPGGSPMAHLAQALCEAGLYDPDAEDALFHLQATLSRSRNGLIEALRQSRAPAGSKLLVVVDQFEELFRFHRASATSQEEAVGFVDLLLQATRLAEHNIYVVLTMRSDFLGECSQFLGLAEAVNDGEFLIPRLTRDQIQEAIEGPIRVRGAEIASRLLFRLLNDVQDNQDQLPVLQHALMRTWDFWRQNPVNGSTVLDLEHYEATGGMREALSRHADEVFDALPSEQHRTAVARIFKTLTERGSDGRGIRRPSRLDQIVAIAAVDEPIVHQVIEAYRGPGVTFLMPPGASPLNHNTVVDISHESLMRVWRRLRGWVEEEAQSARIYRRLHETAGLHAENRAGLYHDPDLQVALSWRAVFEPSDAWASQYGGGFAEAMEFLDASRDAAECEMKAREAALQRELEHAQRLAETQARVARLFKRFAGSLAVGLCLAVAITIWAFLLRHEAKRQEATANEQRHKAQAKEQEAERQSIAAQNAEQAMQRIALRADADKVHAQRENYRSTIKLAESMLQGDVQSRYRVADVLRTAQPELRGWEWGHLLARCPLEDWSLATNQNGLIALATSADGRFLATAGGDGTIALWDSWTRQELWRQPSGRALTLQFDPRNRFVGAGSSDASRPAYRIFDVVTGRVVHEATEREIAQIAFSSSGKELFVFELGKLKRIETDGWSILASAPGPKPNRVSDVLLFVDSAGTYIGVHDKSNEPKDILPNNRRSVLYDTQSLRHMTEWDALFPGIDFNLGSITKPVFDSRFGEYAHTIGPRFFLNRLEPDGSVGISEDSQIDHTSVIDFMVHDARSGTTIVASLNGTVSVRESDGDLRVLSHGLPIEALALFPDGRFITGGADGVLKCWSPSRSARLAFDTAASPSSASDGGILEFLEAGDRLLYRTWEMQTYFLLEMGDLSYHGFPHAEQQEIHSRFPQVQPGVNDVVVDHPTGLTFFHHARDATRGAPTRTLDIAEPYAAAFDATGRILVVDCQSPELAVFDLRANQRLPVPEARGIGRTAVNPAGTRAALLTNDSLQVWEVATGRLVNRLDLAPSVFGPCNANRDRSTPSGVTVHLRPPSFHPNGDLLAFVEESETSSALVLWDAARGKLESTVPGEPGRRIKSCVFSPDGNRLLTPCSDGKMRIWDWRIGQELLALSGSKHTSAVATSPDGATIAYSGWNPSLRIAKALPWQPDMRRDEDLFRAVDDLWILTARRAHFARFQTLAAEDSAGSENKSEEERQRWVEAQLSVRSADEAEILGDIERRRGNPLEATSHYAEAIAERQQFVLAEPKKAPLQYRLAAVFEKQVAVEAAKDPASGRAVLRQAADFWELVGALEQALPLAGRYLVDFQSRHSQAIGMELVTAGQDPDQPPLVGESQALLRRQTLDLLNADLMAWTKILAKHPSVARPDLARTLRHWQQDGHLSGIRDAAYLSKLPAEDQQSLTQFWAAVGQLLQQADEPGSNTDRLRLAQRAYGLRQFAEATRYFSEALDSDPQLGDNLAAEHRYHAARAAAQLAAGEGSPPMPLDDAAKAKLRGRTLAWLKADLMAWDKVVATGSPQDFLAVARMLIPWQRDGALAGIREASALAALPAEEREACAQLWADVAKSRQAGNARMADIAQQSLSQIRQRHPAGSPELAGMLARISLDLLQLEMWVEAELLLRECLAIREQTAPDSWVTFNTRSMLGGALRGQKKYADAEPLLTDGYQGMKAREATIPGLGRSRLPEAVDRLVELYTATDKPEELTKWQAERAKYSSPAGGATDSK